MNKNRREVCHFCVSLHRSVHCPVCDPDAGWDEEVKYQRLRADTAEAELAIIRPERDLYKASSEALEDQWNSAEKRIAAGIAYVQRLVNCSKNQDSVATGYLSDILAALNQKSEGESQSDYLQSCAAAERALAIKPPCQQPQAHPARCGCED